MLAVTCSIPFSSKHKEAAGLATALCWMLGHACVLRELRHLVQTTLHGRGAPQIARHDAIRRTDSQLLHNTREDTIHERIRQQTKIGGTADKTRYDNTTTQPRRPHSSVTSTQQQDNTHTAAEHTARASNGVRLQAVVTQKRHEATSTP